MHAEGNTMSEFALRGAFFLGADGTPDDLVARADGLMQHLLDVERHNPAIHDAAVSLDTGARTVEVELVVQAINMVAAHGMADIDAATREIISIGAREEHAIYRLAVQRFNAGVRSE